MGSPQPFLVLTTHDSLYIVIPVTEKFPAYATMGPDGEVSHE